MTTFLRPLPDASIVDTNVDQASVDSAATGSGVPTNPTYACTSVHPLPSESLYRPANLSGLAFSTTADIEPIDGIIGQQRALDAINFGTQVNKRGFNLFVIGPPGARMHEAVRKVLTAESRQKPSPSDWIYVNNFTNPDKPTAIELPAGRARKFASSISKLIDDLKSALPAVFQSEDYQIRRRAIDERLEKKQGEALSGLRAKAAEQDIVILRTPFGFALAPARNGQVVPPEEFQKWPEQHRNSVQAVIEELEKELEHIVNHIPQWERERRDEVRDLNRETAKFAIGQLIDDTKSEFDDLPRILVHMESVRTDLIENVGMLITKGDEGEGEAADSRPISLFDRYDINVLVAQDKGTAGAPVIEELHPTLANLIGRIEYVSARGVLVTNFRLIKPGAIHRANGGYLLLDVRNLLTEPFSWAALKRVLRQEKITIEDVSQFLGLASTVSLVPDPIPLKVKVVLFGDRLLYSLLAAFDPDIAEQFKVLADFENDIERSTQNEMILARLIGSVTRQDGLKPFDRGAVALTLEHAARLAEHSGKLTLLVEPLRDILIEADFWAGDANRSVVGRVDVERALRERVHRASRLRDRVQESVLQQVALIDTTGSQVGKINGLSVTELGGFAFGRPTRITCQVRPGLGKVVDIEREVELGGPIHSKGVLILSGFLAGRFALDTPMSLYASLVFEQSYGGVEGDSASSAELYVLMSALAQLPLRQDLAVTGSVNQYGEVQAIGGANEKIEGFFDICNARGLTGYQGVLIPQSNVQHLMLREDIVEACGGGRFAIYPVKTIDEGISLLTGLPAGQRSTEGVYPAGTVYRLVEDRLRSFAMVRREFARVEALPPR